MIHDYDEDVAMIYMQHKSLGNDGWAVQGIGTTLAFLDSYQATQQYSPADLVYLRKVWLTVRTLIEKDIAAVGESAE